MQFLGAFEASEHVSLWFWMEILWILGIKCSLCSYSMIHPNVKVGLILASHTQIGRMCLLYGIFSSTSKIAKSASVPPSYEFYSGWVCIFVGCTINLPVSNLLLKSCPSNTIKISRKKNRWVFLLLLLWKQLAATCSYCVHEKIFIYIYVRLKRGRVDVGVCLGILSWFLKFQNFIFFLEI